jgi:hypothetical protein
MLELRISKLPRSPIPFNGALFHICLTLNIRYYFLAGSITCNSAAAFSKRAAAAADPAASASPANLRSSLKSCQWSGMLASESGALLWRRALRRSIPKRVNARRQETISSTLRRYIEQASGRLSKPASIAARSSHFRRLLQRSVLGGGRFSGVITFPIGPIRGRAIAFPRAARVRLLHEYGEEVVNLPDPASAFCTP